MASKLLKVIIDTNLWISFLITKSHSQIDNLLINKKIRIVQCRDPKDNFLLSLAVDSKADYLLTGDNDLLEIGQIGKTKIQTITEFIEKK